MSVVEMPDPNFPPGEPFPKAQNADKPGAAPPAASATAGVGWPEIALAGGALAAWFLLYAAGALVSTASARDKLDSALVGGTYSGGDLILTFLWVACLFTTTNIGLLACLASLLGAVGRRTRFAARLRRRDETAADDYVDLSPPDRRMLHYVSALMRGFGVYALVFAGIVVFATSSVETPTKGEYLRLAAAVSVLSFYVGYDPETFAALIDRVKQTLTSQPAPPADPKNGHS